MDLVEFIRARLDEDERIAREATAGPWSRMGQRVLDSSPPSDRLGIGMAVGHAAATADFNETAEHIARHDPARVLREIDAKRRIVARVTYHADLMGWDEVHGDLLRSLALPYADHPDYREEWTP